MISRKMLALTCMTLAASTVAASAAPVRLAGVYIFDLASGGGSPCVMKLDDNVVADAPGFHNAWLSGGCEGSFSFLMALSGWEEIKGGGIRLVGAEGSSMGDFKPKTAGVFSAVVSNDGKRYTLTRSKP